MGYSGHGFGLGPVAGKLTADLIVDGKSSIPGNISPWTGSRMGIRPCPRASCKTRRASELVQGGVWLGGRVLAVGDDHYLSEYPALQQVRYRVFDLRQGIHLVDDSAKLAFRDQA